MRTIVRQSPRRVIEYDAFQRRVWILGQRCHHGATGSLVALFAFMHLITGRDVRSPALAVVATGGALMAHDWKDHSFWFERGRGTQP